MQADILGAYGQWASAIATAAGLIFVGRQLRYQRIALQAQTAAQIYQSSLEIQKLFVDEPQLRPYFYDEKRPDELMRNKVVAACELMADHWENIFLIKDGLANGVWNVWQRYMQRIFNSSPAVRQFLTQEGFRYSDGFLDSIDDGLPDLCKRYQANRSFLVAKRSQNASIDEDGHISETAALFVEIRRRAKGISVNRVDPLEAIHKLCTTLPPESSERLLLERLVLVITEGAAAQFDEQEVSKLSDAAIGLLGMLIEQRVR